MATKVKISGVNAKMWHQDNVDAFKQMILDTTGVEVVRSLYLDEGNGQATVTVTLKATDTQ